MNKFEINQKKYKQNHVYYMVECDQIFICEWICADNIAFYCDPEHAPSEFPDIASIEEVGEF